MTTFKYSFILLLLTLLSSMHLTCSAEEPSFFIEPVLSLVPLHTMGIYGKSGWATMDASAENNGFLKIGTIFSIPALYDWHIAPEIHGGVGIVFSNQSPVNILDKKKLLLNITPGVMFQYKGKLSSMFYIGPVLDIFIATRTFVGMGVKIGIGLSLILNWFMKIDYTSHYYFNDLGSDGKYSFIPTSSQWSIGFSRTFDVY